MNAERILDVLVAGCAAPSLQRQDGARQLNFIENLLRYFPGDAKRANSLPDLSDAGSGVSLAQLTRSIRADLGRPPGPNHAALLTATGLLHRYKGRGLMRGLCGLGGHLVVNGIAFAAFHVPLDETKSPAADPSGARRGTFCPGEDTPADSLNFARAMIAAVVHAGDIGHDDAPWIVEGFKQCGIGSDDIAWLMHQFREPATTEDLAQDAQSVERAALVYAAVCLAIEQHSLQAQQFTTQLAAALKLPDQLRTSLDRAASATKSPALA